MICDDFEDPRLLQKLQIEEHFFKFRDLYRERMGKIREELGEEPYDPATGEIVPPSSQLSVASSSQ